MRENYLFGPFVGETTYELNYFVGHAIYLRKRDLRNRIIVLTRKENFDLYGRYATTMVPLPIDPSMKPKGFSCKKLSVSSYEELVRRFKMKYSKELKIHGHFYPRLATFLRDLKWYYPRNEIDFDFKTRSINSKIAKEFIKRNSIISEYHSDFTKVGGKYVYPLQYILKDINIEGIPFSSRLGILIEAIRLVKYVHADIDSITGRLTMLLKKPLITKRDFIDAKKLNPINPYGSIVIGCTDLLDGIKYLEGK